MHFYAYAPRPDGTEPVGSSRRAVWHDLKTIRGAVRRAHRVLGPDARVFTFWNFYDEATFRRVL